jgi:hypothetical protein
MVNNHNIIKKLPHLKNHHMITKPTTPNNPLTNKNPYNLLPPTTNNQNPINS